MTEQLTNGKVTISVAAHGAELCSIRHNGREYLWQADPRYWGRHSPVLFPFVGSVWDGEYRVCGRTYKMGQHGFARDTDFELLSKSADEIWYELRSSEASLQRYPYAFVLRIGYRLAGTTVRVMWHVGNPGHEPLPFQIGAHPAFYWPMLDSAAIDAGVEAMEPELLSTDCRGYFRLEGKGGTLIRSVITEGGCVGGKATVEPDQDGYLELTVDTFGRDALVFEDSQVSRVTLCDESRRPYLSMEFSSPLVGLWSPPGKRAPFVCIEPWYGRCDRVGFAGDITEKDWMQTLAPGQWFDAWYDITL